MLYPLILILCEEKSEKIFYSDLGIHTLIVYFCFVLIDLIDDYKNIYSRNNVCMMFLR